MASRTWLLANPCRNQVTAILAADLGERKTMMCQTARDVGGGMIPRTAVVGLFACGEKRRWSFLARRRWIEFPSLRRQHFQDAIFLRDICAPINLDVGYTVKGWFVELISIIRPKVSWSVLTQPQSYCHVFLSRWEGKRCKWAELDVFLLNNEHQNKNTETIWRLLREFLRARPLP